MQAPGLKAKRLAALIAAFFDPGPTIDRHLLVLVTLDMGGGQFFTPTYCGSDKVTIVAIITPNGLKIRIGVILDCKVQWMRCKVALVKKNALAAGTWPVYQASPQQQNANSQYSIS